MMNKIITTIVNAYKDYDGLDELKRGFEIAITISGMDFTKEEKAYMFSEILYRLSKEVTK